MTRYLIGADIGTQSAKVLVFADNGQLVAEGAQALRPLDIPAENLAEHPDDDVWTATVGAFRAAMAAFESQGLDPAAIDAIGLCVIRCCRALLRADGSLAWPLINWMDERLNDPHADHPDYGEVAWVTTSSGYITHRMTGEFRDTCANQIGWWPVDDTTLDWSDDPAMFESCELSRDRLFDLVKPGEILGTLTADAATALGLPAGVPVVATAHDKAVEALGSGVLDPGVGLISLGTYIAAMTHGPKPTEPSDTFWTFQASVPGEWIHECMGVRRGMWAVSWFRDEFGASAVDAAGDQADDLAIEAVLGREAALTPPGSDGLLTIPDQAAPVEAPFRKGAILGLDGRHGRAHLYRSTLEGIALRLRMFMNPMADALGQPWTAMVVSGGGSNSDLMMQILADVFQVPTTRKRLRGAAAIGCAVNAGMAIGLFDDPSAAAERFIEHDATFVPRPEHAAVYDELARRMAAVHDHLDPMFEDWTE